MPRTSLCSKESGAHAKTSTATAKTTNHADPEVRLFLHSLLRRYPKTGVTTFVRVLTLKEPQKEVKGLTKEGSRP